MEIKGIEVRMDIEPSPSSSLLGDGGRYIGLPDKEWGERVTAFIVPKPGRSVASDEIKSFLKSRLSPFKVPKECFVIHEFPKSPQGKILKRQLKKQFLEKPASPGRKNGCK